MEKSEKLLLKTFLSTKPPTDFKNISMGMFVADITGFAQRLLSKGYLRLRNNYEQECTFHITPEGEKEFGAFVGKNKENLEYYTLIKQIYFLFNKYKRLPK